MDLEKLRITLLQTVSVLRATIEKVDKISKSKELVNLVNAIENRLQKFEKETKPVIISVKNVIDKKIQEQKSLKKDSKVNFDFFQ
jgi:hypothetical protein